MEKQIKRFEVGKRYMMRSACNQDCVWMYTVVSRTESTVVLQQLRMGKPYGDKARFRINKGSSEIWGAEAVRPLGTYSMCPTLVADKTY